MYVCGQVYVKQYWSEESFSQYDPTFQKKKKEKYCLCVILFSHHTKQYMHTEEEEGMKVIYP
jgi:hypothetical protein